MVARLNKGLKLFGIGLAIYVGAFLIFVTARQISVTMDLSSKKWEIFFEMALLYWAVMLYFPLKLRTLSRVPTQVKLFIATILSVMQVGSFFLLFRFGIIPLPSHPVVYPIGMLIMGLFTGLIWDLIKPYIKKEGKGKRGQATF